jgi:hypothetical protein
MLLPIRKGPRLAIAYARSHQRLRWLAEAPLHLGIVDCPPADEAADASFATDQPSKARAERHWVADIAALAISGRALKDARGDTPIAKTLDCDLGLLARDLANLRATGHASGDLETQCLGGRLRIRGDRNIDEIGHLDLPVSMLSANSARMAAGTLLEVDPERATAGAVS